MEESPAIPPYAAWSYFEALVRRAPREDLPARVDKALLQAWGIGAGNESSLITTARSLGLIDRGGRPTPDFQALRLSPPRQREALRRGFERAYPGLSWDLDPPIGDDELHDYFVDERGLKGQMVEKATRFYRHLAAAAADGLDGGKDEPRGAGATPKERIPSTAASGPAAAPVAGTENREDRVAVPRAEWTSASGINITMTISLDATEEELTTFFRRVRRAWAQASEEDPRRPDGA